MGNQSNQNREFHRETSKDTHNRGNKELWIEIERSRELLAVAAALQEELSTLHSTLADRYQPAFEERVHRVMIERDEALVNWGRSILGLEAMGVMTRLHFPDPNTPPARARGVIPAWFKENSKFDQDDEGRILGDPMQGMSSYEPYAPAHISEGNLESYEESLSVDESNLSPVQLVAQLISEPDEDDFIDDDADVEEDPGIAEVQHVLLTPSDLQNLQDKISQQNGWSHQEPEEVMPLVWRDHAEALVLRLGAPRAQYDAPMIKQALLDIEVEVECCQQWGEYDREVQNALLSLITSRLRKLQGYIGSNLFDQDRIAKLFRRLTRYSSDFRPGFVQALSRDKTPTSESWEADERDAWKRLERILTLSPPLPKLSTEQEVALERLKEISTQKTETSDFSQEFRDAVSKCLIAGFPSESRHLTEWVLPHLSHLSGRRFKSLRQAQSQLG